MFKDFFAKRINIYLLKEFIKIFLLMLFSIFLLVFIIDFLEFSQNIHKYSIPPIDAIKIVLYRVPSMIESFLQFIILLSIVFTITKISIKSELTILYTNGFSSWKILKLYSVFIFIFGLVVIFFLNFLFSNLLKQSSIIENSYTKKENRYFVESKNGIWFKQNYDSDEILIRASKVYVNELIFKDVIFLFFDKDDNYIKRYDVDEVSLSDDYFILKNIHIYEKNKKIKYEKTMLLETNISRNFMKKLIQNKYENVDLIPLFLLPSLIRDFSNLGFDVHKFIVREHNLLLTPFLYVLMVFVAVLFSNNNSRNTNYFNVFFITICYGVVFFILQNILFELGSSNKINFFISTWGFLLFSFLIIFMFLIKKIELQNTNI